jgi:ferric-dicitrate binding protein FerR (iron transport regulator)
MKTLNKFDHEAFVHLLIKQQAGITTRKENALIKKILQESSEARELSAEVNETSQNENWAKPPKKRLPVYIAAGIALLLVAGACYFLFPRTAAPAPMKNLMVQRGATSVIKLADGTEVKLNAATILRYPADFKSGKREVYVEGEAFFTVQRDPKRPFIVHTNLANVEVLGTSFNVRTYDSSFQAALVSGAIAITTPAGEKLNLRPGYAAYLSSNSPQLLVTSFKPDTVVTWTTGYYRFENTPLREVCRMAERIYDVNILIENKDQGEVRYTGVINRKQPIQYLLEDLGYTAGIDYYFDKAGTLHLTASPER